METPACTLRMRHACKSVSNDTICHFLFKISDIYWNTLNLRFATPCLENRG